MIFWLFAHFEHIYELFLASMLRLVLIGNLVVWFCITFAPYGIYIFEFIELCLHSGIANLFVRWVHNLMH